MQSVVLKTSVIISFIALLHLPANAQEWQYEFEVYLLASTIEGDAGVGRAAGAEVDVDFDQILEVLELGGMAHFEALHRSGWGLILDYGFMELGDDISGPRGGVADFEVRQGVFQADVFYRTQFGNGTLDYLAGVRWWDNDLKVEVSPAVLPGSLRGKVKEDWVDVFVGGRWITPIKDNWDFVFRGDVGGFGLESDFTSSVAVGTRYSMAESWVLNLQYKATWVDYEDGNKGEKGYFAYDTVTHGPLIGFVYQF